MCTHLTRYWSLASCCIQLKRNVVVIHYVYCSGTHYQAQEQQTGHVSAMRFTPVCLLFGDWLTAQALCLKNDAVAASAE